jgi:hypothetical protein
LRAGNSKGYGGTYARFFEKLATIHSDLIP